MSVQLDLDLDQQSCVNALEGVYVVVAGPGSGKTRVLVERYKNLLAHGVNEKDTLNLTFTAEAATEMAARSGLIGAKDVFRTFHSFALDLMQKEREHLPFKLKPAILPWEFEDVDLIQELTRTYPGTGKPKNLQTKISAWKRMNIDPDRARDEAVGTEYYSALAYRDYERRCREEGWLDFDSMMQEAVKLVETNEEVRARYKKKYIQVDEAQDTDALQFRLLQLIFDGNIFVVGDENQLIYEWRNAAVGNLTEFSKYFPGAKTMFLGMNYRSTGAIVEFLIKILPADNGIASHMRTNNPYGVKPTFTGYRDDYQEAMHTLSRIEDPPNTVVIARTNRQLFRFQQACFSRGIKCRILGKKGFWEQNEVKKLLSLAKDSKFPENYNTPMILKALTIQHRLFEKFKWSGNPLDRDPADNIESVYKMSIKYPTIPEFLTAIRKMTYGSRSEKVKLLTLATVHQAKGREWDHVFVVGMTEGILPHEKSNHVEEKRIWFVGASRAAKKLHVTFYRQPSMFLNDFQDQIVEYKPEVL